MRVVLGVAAVGLLMTIAPLATAAPTPTPTAAAAPVCGSLQSLINAAAPGSTVSVPACTYHESISITKSLTLLAAGATVDGDNVRTSGVTVTAGNVTIDGLTVTRVKTRAQVGGIDVIGVSSFTLRNAHLVGNAGAGLSIHGGSGHRVSDTELGKNGQIGFSIGNVADVQIIRCYIHRNNANYAFDTGWEAGGGKFGQSSNVVIDSCEVAYNGGTGIWGDEHANGSRITNNRIHDNGEAGIGFEISDGAFIAGNSVWENGYHKSGWGWGAGIVISSSANAEVVNNTVAWNADGISVISQNRSNAPTVVGNYVHGNVIVRGPRASGDSSDRPLLGWLQDWSGIMYAAASNNRGSSNSYWADTAEAEWARFVWSGSQDTLVKFNATPGEEGGQYLSSAARDHELAAAGIPLAPTGR